MGLQDATDGNGLTPSCKALLSCFIVGHQGQVVGLGTGGLGRWREATVL